MKTIFLVAGACLLGATACGREGDWLDPFYQYRFDLEIEVAAPGWVSIPLDETVIVELVSQGEAMPWDARAFAYNYFRLEAIGEDGRSLGWADDAGFYLVEEGPDLAAGVIAERDPSGGAEPMFEVGGLPPPVREGDEVTFQVEPGTFYLLRYRTSGGSSPALRYEPIHPPGTPLGRHGFRISYEPRLLPLAPTTHETLIRPDDESMTLIVGGRFVNTPEILTLRKARIALLARAGRSGRLRYRAYYQPMTSHFLMVPEARREALPEQEAALSSMGPARKQTVRTEYRLVETKDFTAWFAAGTVRITPSRAVPEERESAVRITSARNERLSFQVVLTPKQNWNLAGLEAADLTGPAGRLPAVAFDIRAVDYVPIRKSSAITPTRYLGWVGDPLVPVDAELLSPDSGHRAFWITVDVPASTAPGLYLGRLAILGAAGERIVVPLELRVRSFALPKVSPFQANVGGSLLLKTLRPTPEGVRPSVSMDYFGVDNWEDARRVAEAHYEVMIRNKFTPKNAALFAPASFRWDPPPEGYNVDAPGNYFRLYDWDFTAFNKTLRRFVDEEGANCFCIYHINPLQANIFNQLHDPQQRAYGPTGAWFLTNPWQQYHEQKVFAYHPSEQQRKAGAVEITRAQHDRLLLDFFRGYAGNLDANGWLDHAVILVDEVHNDRQLLHFLRLMKSDPLTARIRIGVCVQGLSYFHHKEHPDDETYAYHGLIDFYIPQACENYNRWEPFYFSDYGIEPDRGKLWNYYVNTCRSAIDAPDINQRIVGLDLWQRGASGLHIYETFDFPHRYGDHAGPLGHSGDPWNDPFTFYGNGSLAHFYPPRRLEKNAVWTAEQLRVAQPPRGREEGQTSFEVIPSLRVMLFRDGINDYEYAWLLERAMERAAAEGRDVTAALALFAEIERLFHNSNLWTQNDAWLLELRERLGDEIERLAGAPRDG